MRQLIVHRSKRNVVGQTGSMQPRGNFVKKIIPAQLTVTPTDPGDEPMPPIDIDNDGLPETILHGTPGDGNPMVTEDVDSVNFDLDGNGTADLVIPK